MSKAAFLTRCYPTVADLRDALGHPQTNTGYQRARRWAKRRGLAFLDHGRLYIDADQLGEVYPSLAMRLEMMLVERSVEENEKS